MYLSCKKIPVVLTYEIFLFYNSLLNALIWLIYQNKHKYKVK